MIRFTALSFNNHYDREMAARILFDGKLGIRRPKSRTNQPLLSKALPHKHINMYFFLFKIQIYNKRSYKLSLQYQQKNNS